MTMKTAMINWTLGLSVAALSIGGIAYAQQTLPAKPMSEASMMDTNGDGVITRAEAQQKAAEMFAKMDVNKDGKLDQTDREAHHQEMRARMFDKLDTNHDGSISKTEFMADRGPGGDHPPMDGPDGGPGMGGPGGGPGGGPDDPGGPGMDGPHGPGGPGMDGPGKDGPEGHGRHGMRGMHGMRGGMMMAMADANHDGVVTKDEFMAAAMKHFDQADANHDGKVTAEERQAAHEKMKAEWMAKKPQAPGGN